MGGGGGGLAASLAVLVASGLPATVVPDRLLALLLEPLPPHAAGSATATSAKRISRTQRRAGASRGLGAGGKDGRARTPGS